uniref:Uncharacterized protein n=1 Tax=Anguilla anguilla TaxID=7936 RepID=A0A0E9RMI2_ANGAN
MNEHEFKDIFMPKNLSSAKSISLSCPKRVKMQKHFHFFHLTGWEIIFIQ